MFGRFDTIPAGCYERTDRQTDGVNCYINVAAIKTARRTASVTLQEKKLMVYKSFDL